MDLNEGRSAPENGHSQCVQSNPARLGPGLRRRFLTNADPLQNPYSMFRFPVSLKKFPVPLHGNFAGKSLELLTD